MWRWLLLSGVVVTLDQISKYVVVEKLANQPPVEVTSFFNLLLVYNRGPIAVQKSISMGRDPANGYESLIMKGYRGRGVLE